jgi:hypothetical protein
MNPVSRLIDSFLASLTMVIDARVNRGAGHWQPQPTNVSAIPNAPRKMLLEEAR